MGWVTQITKFLFSQSWYLYAEIDRFFILKNLPDEVTAAFRDKLEKFIWWKRVLRKVFAGRDYELLLQLRNCFM